MLVTEHDDGRDQAAQSGALETADGLRTELDASRRLIDSARADAIELRAALEAAREDAKELRLELTRARAESHERREALSKLAQRRPLPPPQGHRGAQVAQRFLAKGPQTGQAP